MVVAGEPNYGRQPKSCFAGSTVRPRSPSIALLSPFLGEGSSTKIDYSKKLAPLFYVTSLPEDLETNSVVSAFSPACLPGLLGMEIWKKVPRALLELRFLIAIGLDLCFHGTAKKFITVCWGVSPAPKIHHRQRVRTRGAGASGQHLWVSHSPIVLDLVEGKL